MKKVFITVMAVAIICFLVPYGYAGKAPVKLPQKLIWNHTTPPGLITKLYDSLWAALDKATQGQITFKKVPKLYKPKEAIEACISGGLKIVDGAPFRLYAQDPTWDIFSLPMLFDNFDHLIRFTNTKEFQGFVADFEKKSGLRLVPGTEKFIMFKMIIYSVDELKSIDDVKGHDMRVQGGPTHARTAKALGTNPIVIASSEVPVAIQTGMFDVMVASQSVGWVKAMGVLDKMKYFVSHPMIMSNVMVFWNADFFYSLPENVQKQLDDASRVWQPGANAKYQEYVDVTSYGYNKKNAKEIVFSKEKITQWRNKVKPVHEAFVKQAPKWGRKLLDAIEATR
ncbi:MAG: TRAP transporter substrate-binding protein DctP [Deltaproteobacteria bacterium]|nr:TRAP transporter substrate-binding protein DctP [Deltaproteobacteria bacterium]